jgi:hypothetical protein
MLHEYYFGLMLSRQLDYKLIFYISVLINGIYYFADRRITFRQNFFLQDWFRNKLGVGLGLGLGLGLELVFGIGLVLVLVKPLLCYDLSL